MTRYFQTLGAFSALIAVVAGAISAHGSPLGVGVIETGARYEMYHALALLILGFLEPRGLLRAAGYFFLAGTILFSGSLYAIGATGWPDFGFITPFGGAFFVLGWAFFGLGLAKMRKEKE